MLRLSIIRGLRVASPVRPLHPLILRSASTLRNPSSITSLQLRKPSALAIATFQFTQKRNAASSVAGKPASENIPHALQNAREEVKGVTTDLAKIIAAANFDKRQHSIDGFSDVTSGIAAEVPRPILITGLAGAIPYVGTAISTLYCARAAGLLAAGHAARVDYDTAMNVLEAAAHVQVTYGAVLLSFLGALHWGMEFAGYGGYKGYSRLALGVAPVVFAWSTLALDPTMALIAQWSGFTLLWYADMRATTAGWTPIWYSQYRFYLSILIGTCIIATLAGENFFNPVIETTKFSNSVSSTTESASSNTPEHARAGGKFTGTSSKLGDIETVEGQDHYVVLKKKAEKEEEGESSEADEEDSDDESAKEHVAKADKKQDEKEADQKKGKAGSVKAGATI